MMKTYVKKPIPVHAFRWDGQLKTLNANVPAAEQPTYIRGILPTDRSLIIRSLEGQEVCKVGDMVVRDVHGEYYPCAYRIFKDTYQEIKK